MKWYKVKDFFSRQMDKTKKRRINKLEKDLADLRVFIHGKGGRDLLSLCLDIWYAPKNTDTPPLKNQVEDIREHLGIYYSDPDCKPKLKTKPKKRKKRA